jgi:hypothetical protein
MLTDTVNSFGPSMAEVARKQETREAPGAAAAVLPRVEPAPGDIWDVARQQAETFQVALRHALGAAAAEAAIIVSLPGEYPVTVTCAFWLAAPDHGSTRRCFAEVKIDPLPHRRKPFRITANYHRAGRTRGERVVELARIDLPAWNEVAEQLANFLLHRTNDPPALFRGPGWTTTIFAKNKWTDVSGGPSFRALAVPVLFVCLAIPVVNVAALIGLVILGIMALSKKEDEVQVLDAGRPLARPRELRFIDSWYALLPGMALLRDRVLQDIARGDRSEAGGGIAAQVETFWYASVDGYHAREQLVFRLRRAEVYVQVVPYGDDLYIGWDAHLNRATWDEVRLHAGPSLDGSSDVTALNSVTRGKVAFGSHDVADVNLLSEQIHRRTRAIVQRLVKERDIDAEIDFMPIRGERTGVLDAQDGKNRSKVRRTA